MDTICVGITAKGERCNHKRIATVGDGTRCRVHHNTVETHGPNKTELNELKYKHKKELNDILIIRPGVPHITADEYNRLRAVMRTRHAREIAEVRHRHAEEIQRTGVDPDEPARLRNQERYDRRVELFERIEDIRMRMLRGLDAPPAPAPVDRNLQRFVNDAQNVHTTEAVKQTKEIVAKIRQIAVPDDYKWDGKRLRTVGEIMCECGLTPGAAAQMFNQYVSPVAIYDIEAGIYGKVLDSVWQYIKSHTDRECLAGILRQEMEDNIGMCAQGNLSRVCNIVAGFMEGVGSQESLVEKLGRLFPPLMSIEDDEERIHRGELILEENNVPREQWGVWLAAL